MTREARTEKVSGFLDRLGKTFTQRPFYHAGGWLAFFLLLVTTDLRSGNYPPFIAMSSQLVNLVFYAIVVYINLLYLFPNYLKKGKYWAYLGILLGVSLMLTPIKLVLKYIIFSKDGGIRQDILDNLYTYFLSMFLVAGLSTVGKIMVDWIVQNRKKVKAENETMQSELRFLKSQINPHFLFNTLNSLYALTLKKDDKAPDIVIKLSEMMRYMLYECNEPRVPLRKEINYLNPLLLIPFLENSFKHGVNANIKDGFVHAKLEVRDRSIHFILENSKGSVMPTQVHAGRPSGGIGLVNVRRRLELLYPEKYQLGIKETPGTYAVHLDLEL